jgi:ubiquitin-conjugating enzyme E2 J1
LVDEFMGISVHYRTLLTEHKSKPACDKGIICTLEVNGFIAMRWSPGSYLCQYGGWPLKRCILPPELFCFKLYKDGQVVLQPNGRFETNKKICLSISGHHPETWQPSWSIRTALLALIAFMPTPGNGTIGSLDYTPEERQMLARKYVGIIPFWIGQCHSQSGGTQESSLKYKGVACLVCDRSQVLECPSCGKVVEQLSSSVSEPPTQEESSLIRQIALKVRHSSASS